MWTNIRLQEESQYRTHYQNSLCVALEDVDRVDGWVSEVPQPEGGVSGGSDHQTLGRVGAAVGQLLIMT